MKEYHVMYAIVTINVILGGTLGYLNMVDVIGVMTFVTASLILFDIALYRINRRRKTR